MLPVAERLRRRGHHVAFAVPTHLAPAVTGEGFDASPIILRAIPVSSESRSPSAIRARIVERLPNLLESTLAVLTRVCEGADVIVTHPLQLAAAMTARKLGLKWISLTTYPGLIPSGYTVPEPHWLPPLPTPMGRAVNRLTWKAFRFGLRHLSGYTPWDEPRGWRDPPELEAFLSGGAPPVVITTSTAGERDAPAFFAAAVVALEQVNKRGILLLGHAAEKMGAEPGVELTPGVVAWPYLPLSRLVA